MTTDRGIERASAILDTARAVFAAEGYAGVSMRGIAARLGISLSNVQHYYPSKEALIEALLLHMMDRYKQAVDLITGAMAQASAVDRFKAAMDIFLDDISNPASSAIFIEIWTLALRNTFAANIVDQMQTRERKQLAKLLAGLHPQASRRQLDTRATLIAAHIEGLIVLLARRTADDVQTRQLKAAARESLATLASAAI